MQRGGKQDAERDGWVSRQPASAPKLPRIWPGAWPKRVQKAADGGRASVSSPPAKSPSKVEKCLALFQAAEQAEASCIIIEAARKQLEEARAERDSAVPPEIDWLTCGGCGAGGIGR